MAHSHSAPLAASYLAGWGAGLYQGVGWLTDTWLEMGRKIAPDPRRSQIYQSTHARCLEARA
ncbi:MAG: hypothetical protein PVF70_08230 [Anaerolineales bacterium]|jgi:hypothetical protein